MSGRIRQATSDPAVVIGGNRIPFARSDGAYAKASNQDMLTAALDGLSPASACRASASATLPPAPCSSTPRTST